MKRLVVLLMLTALFPLPVAAKTTRLQYVPLLGRAVPVSVLDTEVFIADGSLEDWGVPGARAEFGLRGKDTKLCVVDTGIDPSHEQIAPRTVRMYDAIAAHAEVPAFDDHGHGTHVASIAAGDGVGGPSASAYKGVAPKARLFAAKVLNAGGSGTFEQVIEGLTWCAQRPKVDVITMSIGTGIPMDGTDVLSQAVDAVVSDYDKIVTIAAGNLGDAGGSVSSPGAAAAAITVGAAAEWTSVWPPEENPDFSSGPYLAPFSSRGGNTLTPKPDVVAPGATIVAADAGTLAGYVSMSGTSMATPFVAGVALLLRQQHPEFSPAEVKTVLQGTAHDLGPAGFDVDYGYGFVDVRAAFGGTPTAFPSSETVEGVVLRGQTWTYSFTVTDPSQPITVTAIEQGGTLIGGPGSEPGPDPWLDPWFWEPPICMSLSYPGDTVMRYSCQGTFIDTFITRWGRQATAGWSTPGHPPVVGTYTVKVWIDRQADEGYPAVPLKDTAEFTVDIFHG